MPVTVLICAIWLVTWALSIGLSGSWFCICVTSSLRNRSEASLAAAVALFVVLWPLVPVVPEMAEVLMGNPC